MNENVSKISIKYLLDEVNLKFKKNFNGLVDENTTILQKILSMKRKIKKLIQKIGHLYLKQLDYWGKLFTHCKQKTLQFWRATELHRFDWINSKKNRQ